MGSPGKTLEDYRTIGLPRLIEWVGTELPRNVKVKTQWRCTNGHIWMSNFNYIDTGRGCPHCSNHAPKSETDYRELAEQRGLAWIGEAPPATTHDSTFWECQHGHLWTASYHRVRQAKGCSRCNGRAMIKEADYHALAALRGFKWRGQQLPRGNAAKTAWECPSGHLWQAPYHNVQQGSDCPYCTGNAKKTPDDYVALASKRGFEWVAGDIPSDSKTKTLWRCSKGHEWEAGYHSIDAGTGCPLCQNRVNSVLVSKPQLAIHEMLGGELNFRVRRYAIDIALSLVGINIAVEYDCAFWHEPQKDVKRDEFLISHGWRILRIKSANLLPTLQEIGIAIATLLSGVAYTEIILDDWTRHEH